MFAFPFPFMLFTSRVVSRIVVRKERCTLERVNKPHINANQESKDDDPARPITTKHRLISLDTNDNDKQEKEENQYRSSSTVTSSILLLLLLLMLLLMLLLPLLLLLLS